MPNNAFGFDPNAMSAFSFNFAGGPPPMAAPQSGFAMNTSAFDFAAMNGGMMPMGGPMDAMAFQNMPVAGPPPSLFEMVHNPQPTPPPVATIGKPNPFDYLSVDGIKKGFESPVSITPVATPSVMTPSPSGRQLAPSATSTTSTASDFGDDNAFAETSNGGSADFDFASFPDPAAPSPQPTPPPTQLAQTTPIASVPASPAPVAAPESAPVAPKSAEQFLSSIDLNGPPQEHIIEKADPAKPATSYTNESLIKTKIDWSKQRDLMASFLQPSKPTAEEPAPAASEPAPAASGDSSAKPASETEDWGEFDDGGDTNGGDDWSSFDAGHSAPASVEHVTAAHTQESHINSVNHNALPSADTPIASHLSTNQSVQSQSETPSVSAGDWGNNFSHMDPSNGASSFDTSAFDTSAFDTSAFDTSAFNLPGGNSFDAPIPSFPDPSLENGQLTASEPIVETPVVVPTPIHPEVPLEPMASALQPSASEASVHSIEPSKTPEMTQAPSEDLFHSSASHQRSASNDHDFGSFTSNTSQQPDDDWSAFENDANSDTVDFETPAAPALNVPNAASPAETAAKLPKRKSQTKIWDISSFELPSTPVATPTSSRSSSVVSTTVQPLPFPSMSSGSLLDDTPTGTSIAPQSSASSTDLFSLSAPTDSFANFPTSASADDVPSWMNSNKSEDSSTSMERSSAAVREPVDWSNQPTTEELKKTLVSILGTEKSAPFMWIFDNMSKNITISFEDRHRLALGLIDDMKSERALWLSSSRVNQWHSLLSKCNEDILKASSYMSDVVVQADEHNDEVMRRYMVHTQTLTYLSAVSKVYRVASRVMAAIQSNTGVHATSQTPKTTCCYIKPSVLKAILALGTTVENSWNALVEQVRIMEEDSGSSGSIDDSPAMRSLLVSKPVPHAPIDFNCYICYRGFDEHEGSIQWAEKTCHATCANYWVSRVANRPPPL